MEDAEARLVGLEPPSSPDVSFALGVVFLSSPSVGSGLLERSASVRAEVEAFAEVAVGVGRASASASPELFSTATAVPATARTTVTAAAASRARPLRRGRGAVVMGPVGSGSWGPDAP